MKAGNDQGKADIIFSPSPGSTTHLVEVRGCEVRELMPIISITLNQYHGPRWEVHAGRDRGGGKDGLQTAPIHHFLDQNLPIGKLSRMVCAHLGVQQKTCLTVPFQVGIRSQERRDLPPEALLKLIGHCRGRTGKQGPVAFHS